MIINFKKKPDLQAIQEGNNFGDQIILVVDISQDTPDEQRKLHPYLCGKIIYSNTESEGNWIPFTEKELLKRIS